MELVNPSPLNAQVWYGDLLVAELYNVTDHHVQPISNGCDH